MAKSKGQNFKVALFAFGAYFCMYGLRKPYTAGMYNHVWLTDDSFKTLLVASQTLGYVISKWIGIRFVSAIRDKHRVPAIFLLIILAQASLLGFGLVPAPYNAVLMFINGLPLGMIFGLIVRFLEGRRDTEAMIAGLCTSFILADGFAKTIGSFILTLGVHENWMPFWSGALFILPLFFFTHALGRSEPPTPLDLQSRSLRSPMKGRDRIAFFRNHAPILQLIMAMYVLVTIMRSLRADFAPEYWKLFNHQNDPLLFTVTEVLVAVFVLVVNGLMILVKGHVRAFQFGLALSLAGMLILLSSNLFLHVQGHPWTYMVLTGLGLYLPYVAVHTTLFERMVALKQTPGNIGYPMYLADSAGYTAYFLLMLSQLFFRNNTISLELFRHIFLFCALSGTLFILVAFFYSKIKSIQHDSNGTLIRKGSNFRRQRQTLPLDPSGSSGPWLR